MISTSTGEFRGSSETPTAERACAPLSPNTSPNSSEAPLMTPGCPSKSLADATNPTTLTTRTTASMPTRACTAASAFNPQSRASSLASSALTSAPTLPVASSAPARIGNCPEV